MVFGWFRPKFPALKEKADKALARRDLPEAIRLYGEALERAKDEPESVRDEVRKKLAESRDELARTRLAEARKFFSDGLLDEAEELAEIARDRADDAALRAEAEALLKDIASRDAAETGGEQEPEAELEDPEERLESYLELVPEELKEGYRRLGAPFRDAVLLAHEGDPAEALAKLEPFVEKEPAARYERGLCRLLLEDYEGAASDLEAVREKLEPDEVFYRRLSDSYRGRATSRGAKLGGLTPRSRETEPRPALAAEAKADLERAAGYLTSALEIAPREGELYRALIEAFTLADEPERARRAAEAGLRRITTPQYQRPVLLALGIAEAAYARWDEAEAALDKVVSATWGLDPDRDVIRVDRDAAWLLARILIDRGRRLDRALDLVRALAMSAGENERWPFLLSEGEILGKTGKKEEARARLEEMKKLAPKEGPAAERIEAALKELE
jgi:tetratricopeptide (TPR) repeat protein